MVVQRFYEFGRPQVLWEQNNEEVRGRPLNSVCRVVVMEVGQECMVGLGVEHEERVKAMMAVGVVDSGLKVKVGES